MRYFFLSLLTPILGVALPIGNPSSPLIPEEGFIISKESPATLFLNFIPDWTLQENFKLTRHNLPINRSVENFSMMNLLGNVALNLGDRFLLGSYLGSSNFSLSQIPTNDVKLNYTSNASFCYGVSAIALIAFWKNIDLSLSANYLLSNGGFDHIDRNETPLNNPKGNFNYSQWNVGVGFSYKMDIFTPYIGAFYSQAILKFKNLDWIAELSGVPKFRIINKRPAGIFAGCGIEAYKGLSLGVEVQLVSVMAINLNATLRF